MNSPAISQESLRWPSKIALFLINSAFFIWVLLCSAVISSLSFPVICIRYRGWKREKFQPSIRRFIQFYGRWIIRLSWPMIRVRVEIPEEVKKADPCVYVLNHFSFVDVYFCGFLPGFQTVIAVRAWPFKLPIYNIFMRLAGYLNVEAKSGEEILSSSAEVLKSGACLLFFPEGHRSRDGQLMPLQKGAFRIAAENKVPLVPVAIEGTEFFGGYKSKLPRPCRIRLRLFTPLRAGGADLASVNALRSAVRTLFLQEVYAKKEIEEVKKFGNK
jgi:1-acyl-sn-glycerol-3-phosphate acyltransferase